MRALHHSRRRRRWQVCPCDLRRAILDQPRTRMEAVREERGVRERESAWVDGFWHSESVSVQLEDRETACTLSRSLTHALPPSPPPALFAPPPLSLLRFPPLHPFSFSLSYSLPLSCSLSHSATTLGSTQAGSQCVVSLRVVVTLLSPFRLFLDPLSVASAASRRYDVLRRLSPIGRRDVVVNFPTIRAELEESTRTPDP